MWFGPLRIKFGLIYQYPKQALNLMLASWVFFLKKKTELSVEVEANVKTIAPWYCW